MQRGEKEDERIEAERNGATKTAQNGVLGQIQGKGGRWEADTQTFYELDTSWLASTVSSCPPFPDPVHRPNLPCARGRLNFVNAKNAREGDRGGSRLCRRSRRRRPLWRRRSHANVHKVLIC